MIATVDVPGGCGLAPGETPGTFLLTSGRGHAVHVDAWADRVTRLASRFLAEGRWDNHVALVREPEGRGPLTHDRRVGGLAR